MAYFGNFNLASYAVTPAQSPDGKLFMFFGTISQELTFYGPASVATFTLATIRISIPDEEDDSIALTPKGISNNVMASPTTSPKRRRRPSKKTTSTAAAQITRNSQVSKKRALDAYQNQLVARPAIPVSNKFTALRIVAKNSATGQLRRAWEVPKPAPRPIQASSRGQRKSQAPAEAIYKAHRALKQRKSVRNARLRQYVSRSSQSQELAQPQAIIPAPRRFTSKVTPSIQQVWVPKGSQPMKPQFQTQPSKAGNSSAPSESVFSRLGQKSVFSRLGSRVPLNSLKVIAPDQIKKKRRTARYEKHFSVNTISISYDTDPDTDTEVNMVQDDQSPPNQAHVTNTNKNNGRKGRPPKRVNPEGNNREGEDHNENPDLFNNEDDIETRPEVPIDEIEILKGHIEARDEELIRQRELIATMLKQNEELIKAAKSLQESQDANFKAGSSCQEGVHSTKSNRKGKQPGEEEEVKFNLKPRGARIQKLGRKSGEEVAFHFKQVATSKVRTKLSEINSSDSEE
jgi:hypothetical protein